MGASTPTWLPTEGNAFLRAAHLAYALHYPLSLSPDAVWLCIAQGFAAHVKENAERLRGKFVRHEGQATLKVRRDDFVKGSPANPWPEAFAAFSDAIAEHIGKQRDLVVCDFSTTGPCERAASEIVLLDAMQRYFHYELHSLCGIPEITLEGTVDDWRSVRARARALEEYELRNWTRELNPVLDAILATAEGKVDRAFWERFFKHVDGSGGPWVRGWINVLFPYLRQGEDGGLVPNPLFGKQKHGWQKGLDAVFGGGAGVSEVPSGLSTAPFVWEYLKQRFSMELLGGFTGIAQDPATLAVRPVIGWAVREAGGQGDAGRRSPGEGWVLDSDGEWHMPEPPRWQRQGAHLLVGWLSEGLWLARDEIEALGARVEAIGAAHQVPLAWALAGNLGSMDDFPEAPAVLRVAVGLRLAETGHGDEVTTSLTACARALRQARELPPQLREALDAAIPRGLAGEPGLQLTVAGSHLRGSLTQGPVPLAEVFPARCAAVTVRPMAPGIGTVLTLRAERHFG
jgi:hypothetical protein